MRTGRVIIVLMAVVCAACLSYWPYLTWESSEDQTRRGQASREMSGIETGAGLGGSSAQTPGPVPANPSPEVANGFRGNVHPLLHGRTRLEVAAHWSTIGKGRDKLDENVPDVVYAIFRDAKPAKPTRTYTERELSAFLPEKIETVGQIWAMDPDRVAAVLEQFHPNVSMHLKAKGRRGGPDGAFGMLRATSPDYLDVVWRIHAEFNLTPKEFQRHLLPVKLWYTPAYFTGHMLVNRKAGTVDYFRLGVPVDKSLNIHLTVFQEPYGENHDIVRVEQMELVGGDGNLLNDLKWDRSVELAQANARLTNQFYKFNDIAWVPPDKALAAAKEKHKPILAMVLWGAIDDQSC
jgi:hypothetical protein